MNFRQYISSLRTLLKKSEGSSRFVLGNSGADYDSVIGSIVYAFYITTTLKVLHLPLIDCPEKDLALRFEITTVLDSMSIRSDQLLYTQMIPNLYTSNHSFSLYDHNTRPQIKSQNITEIVDHHAYDHNNTKCNHLINHCGSALTLLYYLYYPHLLTKFQGTELYNKYIAFFMQHHPIQKQQLPQDQQMIDQLLYNGILIDSYGLSPKQTQVWNEFDQFAVESLQKKITPKFSFDDLVKVKFNVERNLKLSFTQQQKKDYKEIKYGDFVIHYSTILLNIDLFVQRYWNQIHQELPLQKMKENEVHAFMFSFPLSQQDLEKSNFRKYILFNSKNKQLIAKLENMMKELNFDKLEDVDGWKKWTDPTGKISRKIFDKELKSRL